jgi:hypothetical protein
MAAGYFPARSLCFASNYSFVPFFIKKAALDLEVNI